MNQRGSAVLIVLWVILIVSIIAMGIGYQLELDAAMTQEFKEEAQARESARSLFWWAVFQLQNDVDDVDTRDEFQFKVDDWRAEIGDIPGTLEIKDEGSRMNLNMASQSLLKEFFERLDCKDVIDPLIDWRDPDDQSLDGGTELSHYAEVNPDIKIRNGFLPVVQEFRKILGGKDAWEKLKDRVTVAGPANLFTMDKVVFCNILRETDMKIDITDPIMTNFERMMKAKQIKSIDDLKRVDSRINQDLIEKLRDDYIVTDGTFNPNFISEECFRSILAQWKITELDTKLTENEFKDKDEFAKFLTAMKPDLSSEKIWSYFSMETKIWRVRVSIKTAFRVLQMNAIVQRVREKAGARWNTKILSFNEVWLSDKGENDEPTEDRSEPEP
ncbi:MAG TPA: hypothetical protein VHR47_00255 [Bacillota bacterium]|nr:hypothetical protein [Bacillota bacterium]